MFPFSLSEWSFTMCPTPYNRTSNVWSVLLNKTFLSFIIYNYTSNLLLLGAGFRPGQLPRGLHNQGPPQPGASTTRGPPHMSCHLLLFWYSRVVWASIAPLQKAAQELPHV